jgi:PAS domain S-box-containing protein
MPTERQAFMTFKDHLQGFLDRDDVPLDVKSTIEEQLASYDRIATDEAVFRTLGSNLRTGLLAQDETGTITYVNERLAHMTGYLRVDLLGRPLATFVPEHGQHDLEQGKAPRPWGSQRGYDLVLRRADGHELEVTLTPYPLFDDQGQNRGNFAIVAERGNPSQARDGNGSDSERLGDRQRLESLSPREQEILGEVLSGKRVTDIAQTLSISRHTVRNHLKAIYRKLGVHSQVELLGRFWAPSAASRDQLLAAAGARPASALDD